MKKTNFFQNKLVKGLSVALLTLLSVCCFTLGFLGLTSRVNITEAKATGLRAWYRFDAANYLGTDSSGNGYDLVHNNTSTAENTFDGVKFVPSTVVGTDDKGNQVVGLGESKASFYAPSGKDPLANLTTTDSVSICALLQLGYNAGGSNMILWNCNWDGNFGVVYDNATLRVYLGGQIIATWGTSVISSSTQRWYRLIITIDGSTVTDATTGAGASATIRLYNVTTGLPLAPNGGVGAVTKDTSTTLAQLYLNNKVTHSLAKGIINQSGWAFAINGKSNTSGTGCGGTQCRGTGAKISDLKIYNGVISDGEVNLIVTGDKVRGTSMSLVSAYENDSYYNWDGDSWELDNHAKPTNSIAYDSTRFASLQRQIDINGTPTCNTVWDNATMSSLHSGPESILHAYGSEEAKFRSNYTGSMKELDYSDYMRKGSFLVAMRAYVCGGRAVYHPDRIGSDGKLANIGSAYYLLNTGAYSNGFSLQVDWDEISATFSRRDCVSSSVDALSLSTTDFGLTSGTYEWVNIIAYSTNSHVYLCVKKDRDADWTTVSQEYAGSNFGGFGYSLTLGGQSNFGANTANKCYVTGYTARDTAGTAVAGDAYTRDQVRLRSTKIYAGAITDSNIANVKADLNNLRTVVGSSTPGSATLQAHYRFDGKSAIGKDLTANGYDLANPGNMAYSAEDGGLVLDYNNSTNPSENPDHYLYAKRGIKTSTNLDWSDKYQGSFSVAMRVKLSTAEAGRAHKIYSTTRHGGGSDNYTGSHAAYQGNTFEIMINGIVLYFNNVLDATPSWYRVFFCYNDKANEQAYLAIVFKETSAEYFVQQVKTVKDMCDETLATTDAAKTAARNNNTAWTNSDNTDFGGNASYVFTIGAQSTGNLGNKDTGAGSGPTYYDPVMSEFRFYSGVVDKDDINEILAMDLQEADYALDADRCSVNMDIGSNMNFNHHMRIQNNLQLSGLKVYYNYNGHTEQNGYAQIVSPVLDKTGDYVSTMSLMAPQDMNDIIQIAKITYDRVSVTGEVSFDATKIKNNQALVQVLTTETLGFGGWDKLVNANNGYSAKQYLNEIISDTKGKYDATAKATAQALLDYGTAAQIYLGHITDASGKVDYINGSGVLDDPTKEQLDWLSNNTVKNLIVESSSSAVQPWVRNIKIDTNLGIGIRYSLPKGYSAEAFTVKVFSGTDISGTPLVESSLSECEKLTNDNWWFDAYQVGYEGVKITRMLDTYTFVVYEEKENGEFEIVSQISMNFAAVLEGYIYSNNLNNVSIAKALLKLYYVANDIS